VPACDARCDWGAAAARARPVLRLTAPPRSWYSISTT